MPADVPSLNTIDEEIRAGLPAGRERREAAWTADEVYQLRSGQFLEKREAETDDDFQRRPKPTSAIARIAVERLCEPVYDPGPSRVLEGGGEADGWLQRWLYGACHANAVLGEAEAAAVLGDCALLQVEATGEPARPIRVWLWRAHEVEVFTRDGDAQRPWAVVVRDQIPAGHGKVRSRYRVWSAEQFREYQTAPFDGNDTSGGRRADYLIADEPNPYGVLPFVVVRLKPAVTVSRFWEGGVGAALGRLNLELDRKLANMAEHVEGFLNPKAFARNVAVGSRWFDRVGSFIQLTSTRAAMEGESSNAADVFYLQAQLGVEQAWYDVRALADATLEELGLPLTAVRSDAATDLSGVAILAKTLPLEKRTRKRQAQLVEVEQELARLALLVAGRWYKRAALEAAASRELVVTWPEASFPLPTAERDASDDWELARGLTDPIELLARRKGITLAQAEALAGEIAARRATWNALMAANDGKGLKASNSARRESGPETEGEDGETEDADEFGIGRQSASESGPDSDDLPPEVEGAG